MHPSLTPPVPPWGRHSPIDSDLGGTLLWERRTAAQAGPDFLAPAPLWQLGSVSPPPSFGLPCPMGHLGVCHPHQASASPAPMGHQGSVAPTKPRPHLLALPLVLQLLLYWVLPGAALRVGGWGLPAAGELRAVCGSLLWGKLQPATKGLRAQGSWSGPSPTTNFT